MNTSKTISEALIECSSSPDESVAAGARVQVRPATPLPWALFGDGSVRKPGGLFSETGELGVYLCRPDEWDDADYMVHACNAYPRLVAALKSATFEIKRNVGEVPSDAYDNALALLRELGE